MLVYTTISGAVGALIPFASMDDVDFMTTLEMVSITSQALVLLIFADCRSTCGRITPLLSDGITWPIGATMHR